MGTRRKGALKQALSIIRHAAPLAPQPTRRHPQPPRTQPASLPKTHNYLKLELSFTMPTTGPTRLPKPTAARTTPAANSRTGRMAAPTRNSQARAGPDKTAGAVRPGGRSGIGAACRLDRTARLSQVIDFRRCRLNPDSPDAAPDLRAGSVWGHARPQGRPNVRAPCRRSQLEREHRAQARLRLLRRLPLIAGFGFSGLCTRLLDPQTPCSSLPQASL